MEQPRSCGERGLAVEPGTACCFGETPLLVVNCRVVLQNASVSGTGLEAVLRAAN